MPRFPQSVVACARSWFNEVYVGGTAKGIERRAHPETIPQCFVPSVVCEWVGV